jgi:hypothetical protein
VKTARPPGPSFRDWALLSISLVFVAGGLFMLTRQPREALLPLTFFAVCAITFSANILRKRRRRRFTASAASVPGGVKLRGSNARMSMLAVLIAAPGIAIFLVPTPVYIRACGAVALGAGAWLLFMVFSGRIARRFLRFDPPGLTVGEPSHEYFVPWDVIDHVVEFELVDNASVGFRVRDFEAVTVSPPDKRDKLYKAFANNAALSGPHVVFMASHFNVPAEALCAAIRNYAENPAARFELVPRPGLGE